MSETSTPNIAFPGCPECGASNVIQRGMRNRQPVDKIQKYQCENCGYIWKVEEERNPQNNPLEHGS